MKYLIAGIIEVKDNAIEILSYLPTRIDHYSLMPLTNLDNQSLLTSGNWKFAGTDLMSFDFQESGQLKLIEKGVERALKWSLDDSGYLIIMTEKSGEKKYAIKNFKLTNKRIGFEIKKGRFTDILNLKN